MKCYEITIKPQSGFGTALKGDTIFGHVCWQAQYDERLLNGGLDRWIEIYPERPFAVFSSAFPKLTIGREGLYALKRPDLPMHVLFPGETGDRGERMKRRKEDAKRKWMLVGKDLKIDLKTVEYKDEGEIVSMCFGALTEEMKREMRGKDRRKMRVDFIQPHNSIDRRTMTTGEGMFSPYSGSADFFYPKMELALFVLIDEEATDIDRIRTALERIGAHGFGRDASTGMGRFELAESEEKILPDSNGANALYTLAPCVPEEKAYRDYHFSSFTRFGRHGDVLAISGKPFKNPVIMADEGAVFIPADDNVWGKPYMGRAITGLSKSEPRTVAQGYTPYLPIYVEETL